MHIRRKHKRDRRRSRYRRSTNYDYEYPAKIRHPKPQTSEPETQIHAVSFSDLSKVTSSMREISKPRTKQLTAARAVPKM
jgi:hypothetical protein